jgi:hypothetical protein
MEIIRALNFEEMVNVEYIKDQITNFYSVNEKLLRQKSREMDWHAFDSIKNKDDLKNVNMGHVVQFLLTNYHKEPSLNMIFFPNEERNARESIRLFDTGNGRGGLIKTRNIFKWINMFKVISMVTDAMATKNDNIEHILDVVQKGAPEPSKAESSSAPGSSDSLSSSTDTKTTEATAAS